MEDRTDVAGIALMVSVHLALARSEHSNRTCDPWHARQWETSQIGGWARLHDLRGHKEQWRAHCCQVLPRVSDQPASDEDIPEKGEGFGRHQPAQS